MHPQNLHLRTALGASRWVPGSSYDKEKKKKKIDYRYFYFLDTARPTGLALWLFTILLFILMEAYYFLYYKLRFWAFYYWHLNKFVESKLSRGTYFGLYSKRCHFWGRSARTLPVVVFNIFGCIGMPNFFCKKEIGQWAYFFYRILLLTIASVKICEK